jgi:hypothetical protein
MVEPGVATVVVVGISSLHETPMKPRWQWHLFIFVQNCVAVVIYIYIERNKISIYQKKCMNEWEECVWLTPFPEHSILLWFVGHFDVSMYGKMLTHVWLTQTRFVPHGVPSSTRPCSGKNSGFPSRIPLVDLQMKRASKSVNRERKFLIKNEVHFFFLAWIASLTCTRNQLHELWTLFEH